MQRNQIAAPLNHQSPIPSLQWIEVSSTLQVPSFHVVGLPGPEVNEARERVRSAILASHFEFPRRRVVLNLSPASVRKAGTGIDLAMALAILSADNESEKGEKSRRWVAWGELGLDGAVKPAGQLMRAIHACWSAGVPFLFIARAELAQAETRLTLLKQSGEFSGAPPRLLPVADLGEAWELISDFPALPDERSLCLPEPSRAEREFSELMSLSPAMERVLGVAAAGAHHLLLLGPRGAGKSHALEWLVALQPPVHPRILLMQALLAELSMLSPAFSGYPVRRVGAQARPAALLGAATPLAIRPGEFSLAHGGLLLADELPEWPRDTREALREPLERGVITLTRLHGRVELPARFTLGANGNFCPCGGWPSEIPLPRIKDRGERKILSCSCTPKAKQQYQARLSGPVLDRTDLVVNVTSLPPSAGIQTERLENLRAQVRECQEKLIDHWGEAAGRLSGARIEELLEVHPTWREVRPLTSAPSLRSRHKIVRVALTLAAWDRERLPSSAHFEEAASYRSRDFQ